MVDGLQRVKKQVEVEVIETRSFDGEQGTQIISQCSEGTLYPVDKQTYILSWYSILKDEKVVYTAKLKDNTLSLVGISGGVHSRRTFTGGEWDSHQYFYSGQSIMLRSFTKTLDYAMTPDGGMVEALYELWSGDAHLGYSRLEIFAQ